MCRGTDTSKYLIESLGVRNNESRLYIENIVERRGNCFFLFSSILCYLLLDFHVKTRTRLSLRCWRLFEISEVEIKRVDCILSQHNRSGIPEIVFFALNFRTP